MKYITLILLLIPAIAFPQRSKKLLFSAGVEGATPALGLKYHAGGGLGLSARAEYPLNDHFSAIATLGFLSFQKKTFASGTSTIEWKNAMAPIFQSGIKFYPLTHGHWAGVYVSMETGVHYRIRKTYLDGQPSNPPDGIDLSFAPGIGLKLKRFDLSLRRQYTSLWFRDVESFYSALRLAYLF